MTKIEAIIRVDTYHPIKDELENKGFISMTVYDVYGRGKQKGVALKWREGEHRVEFLPKKKIEMVVDDKDCETVVNIICEKGRTGSVGDGKIFLTQIQDAIRIRTGERGLAAL